MNEQEFRTEYEADGFDIQTFQFEPNQQRAEHAHPWDARLLLLEGALTLGTPDGEATYRPGETCAVDAGTPHTETTGSSGARGLVAKKAPA